MTDVVKEACVLDDGDTSWMLMSTGLVFCMTPALALFEAGLLRSKNTLSIITQVMTGMITLSLMWLVFGYSMTFGTTHAGVIASPFEHIMFIGVPYDSCSSHALTIPAATFALFQMMFAAITPLLITGAYAERVPFKVFFTFTVLWEVLVYYPVAHWIWGGGWLSDQNVVDFAGGITIHTTAGVASLITAYMVGPRLHFDVYHGEFPPSSIPLAATGAGLLWLGWFGFNGGSALEAGHLATSAAVSTQMGAVASAFVWLVLAWYRGKPSTTALLNGALAGLAGVTPASGYISSPATIVLGLILGVCSYTGVYVLKHKWHIDDALEVSMVHGLTGVIGSIYIGFCADASLNEAAGINGVIYGDAKQLGVQVLGVVVAAAWTAFVTVPLLWGLKRVFGSLRVDDDEEDVGLDWIDHGEIAYHKLHVLDENDRMLIAHLHQHRNGASGGGGGGSSGHNDLLVGNPHSGSLQRPFLSESRATLPRSDDYRKAVV